MDRIELKQELDKLGINPRRYSLYGDLNFDCIILYENYSKWEFFYLDERGRRARYKIFQSESDACLHVYKFLKDAKDIEDGFGLTS